MVECWLPYGETEVHVSIPIRNLVGVSEPVTGQPELNLVEAISGSIKVPIGAKPLNEIVKPADSIAIGFEGTMSPQNAAASISAIIEELSQAGASIGDVAIVVGNACRAGSNMNLLEVFESLQPLKELQIVEHTRGTSDLREVGTTSQGTDVEINTHFADSDLRIVVGEVLLDAYTGLKGAHCTVLPALSGLSTIERNRRLAFHRNTAPGVIEGNQLLSDVFESTDLSRVDFAVNLAVDPKGRLLRAFSGSPQESWKQAVSVMGDSFRVEAEADADIIVVSAGGSKFDYDLYHGAWALQSVSQITKKGAIILLLAECSEGLGADGLKELPQVDTLSELKRRYMLGAEVVHLIKSTLRRNRVILVSALPDYLIEPLGLSSARTANAALDSAVESRRGRRTLVVTHGCSTLPLIAA